MKDLQLSTRLYCNMIEIWIIYDNELSNINQIYSSLDSLLTFDTRYLSSDWCQNEKHYRILTNQLHFIKMCLCFYYFCCSIHLWLLCWNRTKNPSLFHLSSPLTSLQVNYLILQNFFKKVSWLFLQFQATNANEPHDH